MALWASRCTLLAGCQLWWRLPPGSSEPRWASDGPLCPWKAYWARQCGEPAAREPPLPAEEVFHRSISMRPCADREMPRWHTLAPWD
eukprot:scaffold79278_cov18-Prasinocladus_malaysianus.AAC.3